MDNLDDLELIKLVEKQPCLYAKRNKSYKEVDKGAVWDQIGSLLTNQKTGTEALKRWDSLRTQWSREHKRKREYQPSGSGATHDTQEFTYYNEMSFLIPYYIPRPTRGNIMKKVPIGPSSSDSNNSCMDMDATYSTDIWNADLLGSCTDEVSTTDSSSSASQTFAAPPSEAARAALNQSTAPLSRGNIYKKFKSSNTSKPVVPPSDDFAKKKKSDLDMKLDRSLDIMATVAQQVCEKKEKQVQEVDPEVECLISLIRVSMQKRVKPEHQYACLRRIQEVIDEFEKLS